MSTPLTWFTAVRCRRSRYLLPLQVLRRLHQRGPPQGGGLVHPRAYLLRSLPGAMGSLPLPKQHLHVAQGGAGEVH